MQIQINPSNLNTPNLDSEEFLLRNDKSQVNSASNGSKSQILKGVYRQLFKENRDLGFFHNLALDSAYLNGRLSTRELVCELLKSQMYIDYLLAVNSNYRFVQLCFERVLGRPATQKEIFSWSSLIASQGIETFAQQLTSCDEYLTAFGDNIVPFRRSEAISSSNQGLPALPKELSIKRYQGEGNRNQLFGSSSYYVPYKFDPVAQKVGAVLAAAGAIGTVGLFLEIAWEAFKTGL